MSKVNWEEALALYATQKNQSYEKLAVRYGVAKSTITRHAVRHNWPKVKKEYQQKRLEHIMKGTLKARLEAEGRQLGLVRRTLGIADFESRRLAYKLQTVGELSKEETRQLWRMLDVAKKSIKIERLILGLPTRPVRITNPESITEARQVNFKIDATPGALHIKAKKALAQLDEQRERLKRYIDRVESSGDYNEKL